MYQRDKLSPDVTVPLNDVQKALVEARALIERGWCQNKFAVDGKMCAVGALDASFAPRLVCSAADRAVRIAIGTANIVNWNDDPSRTKAEVVAAFTKAIEIAGR